MMKNVSALAAELGHDVEKVKLELRKVQSTKCRLKAQKTRPDYEVEMTKVVKYEQLLKEVRDMLVPKKTTVTTISEAEVKLLNYDETVKAIKSIQSKKCLSQYATEKLEDNVEYQRAVEIENMLKAHKDTLTPVEKTVVEKSKVNDILKTIQGLDDKVAKEYLEQQLKALLEG